MIQEIKITSISKRGTLTIKTRDFRGYWLGPVDWGQAQGQHNTYAYYNQVGSSIVSTSILARALSITGWVIEDGQGTMQSRCDFLNSFISPAEDYILEYKNRKIRFRPDCSVIYSTDDIQNNEKKRKFMIQGTCPYPLFTDSVDTAIPFEDSGKLLRFPTDFGQDAPFVFGIIGKAFSMEVNNKGGFSTGIIIRIHFLGEVKNPRLKNLTTDKFIGVARTFARGERLEISTVPGEKYITLYKEDGTQQNLIKYRDYRTSWIQLEPGVNRLAIDCDDLDQRDSMEVTVYFTPLYLEVE